MSNIQILYISNKFYIIHINGKYTINKGNIEIKAKSRKLSATQVISIRFIFLSYKKHNWAGKRQTA